VLSGSSCSGSRSASASLWSQAGGDSGGSTKQAHSRPHLQVLRLCWAQQVPRGGTHRGGNTSGALPECCRPVSHRRRSGSHSMARHHSVACEQFWPHLACHVGVPDSRVRARGFASKRTWPASSLRGGRMPHSTGRSAWHLALVLHGEQGGTPGALRGVPVVCRDLPRRFREAERRGPDGEVPGWELPARLTVRGRIASRPRIHRILSSPRAGAMVEVYLHPRFLI
jgi:hypothetical protein